MPLPYNAIVMEHFKNPRNVGKMDDPDGKSTVGSPACGDMVSVYIEVDEKTKVITDVKFDLWIRKSTPGYIWTRRNFSIPYHWDTRFFYHTRASLLSRQDMKRFIEMTVCILDFGKDFFFIASFQQLVVVILGLPANLLT